MKKGLNSSQAKLLATFASDLAKGLILAGTSTPFLLQENLFVKELLILVNFFLAVILLRTALEILKGVKE